MDRIARASVLCNEADLHHSDGRWVWRGDPTDIALLTMARKLGWNRETTLNLYPQVNEIPVEPEHQFAATYHPIEDQVHVLVKGAPERLLKMCDAQPNAPSSWIIAQHLAGQGYRVLALVEGIAPADLDPTKNPPEPSNLTLLGFVGMIDPLRPGVKGAIAACHTAGIAVRMVTGDHETRHRQKRPVRVNTRMPIKASCKNRSCSYVCKAVGLHTH